MGRGCSCWEPGTWKTELQAFLVPALAGCLSDLPVLSVPGLPSRHSHPLARRHHKAKPETWTCDTCMHAQSLLPGTFIPQCSRTRVGGGLCRVKPSSAPSQFCDSGQVPCCLSLSSLSYKWGGGLPRLEWQGNYGKKKPQASSPLAGASLILLLPGGFCT